MALNSQNSVLTLTPGERVVTVTILVEESGNYTLELPDPSEATKVIMLKIDPASVEDFNVAIDNTHMIVFGVKLNNVKSHARLESRGNKWVLRSGAYINLNS